MPGTSLVNLSGIAPSRRSGTTSEGPPPTGPARAGQRWRQSDACRPRARTRSHAPRRASMSLTGCVTSATRGLPPLTCSSCSVGPHRHARDGRNERIRACPHLRDETDAIDGHAESRRGASTSRPQCRRAAISTSSTGWPSTAADPDVLRRHGGGAEVHERRGCLRVVAELVRHPRDGAEPPPGPDAHRHVGSSRVPSVGAKDQSSKVFQQMGLRRRWSSRTRSRTSAGSWSRCQSRSASRTRSASSGAAAATAARMA